jgi:hypothetical protein
VLPMRLGCETSWPRSSMRQLRFGPSGERLVVLSSRRRSAGSRLTLFVSGHATTAMKSPSGDASPRLFRKRSTKRTERGGLAGGDVRGSPEVRKPNRSMPLKRQTAPVSAVLTPSTTAQVETVEPQTRQALFTGRNHHAVGMGGIAEIVTSAPGYDSIRPASAAPLAEILRPVQAVAAGQRVRVLLRFRRRGDQPVVPGAV